MEIRVVQVVCVLYIVHGIERIKGNVRQGVSILRQIAIHDLDLFVIQLQWIDLHYSTSHIPLHNQITHLSVMVLNYLINIIAVRVMHMRFID